MQTRREYLVTKGLAKEGRGKLSRAAHEEIARAVASGMEFSDLQDRPVVVKRTPKERPADGNVEVTEENRYAGAFMRYPLDQVFKYDHEGKSYEITGRTACMTCGFSLVGHICNHAVGLTFHGQKELSPKGE